jgi:nitrite reductase/ring-hydroxylating ferredoxin subunit
MSESNQLSLAGVYRRRVGASLARIWENVFDWEHLPALHETSFADVRLVSYVGDEQVVQIDNAGGHTTTIRTIGHRAEHRYVVHTTEGRGTGSEVRVQLTPIEPHLTDVEVQYRVPEHRPERLQTIGDAFVPYYARLWDEDEVMMRTRETRLRTRRGRPTAAPVNLGEVDAVEAALPLTVEVGGEPFRVLRDRGELIAHAAVCPHWLGPLDDTPVEAGVVRCPWHGWRFDVRTGAEVDGRPCRLPRPPTVSVEAGEVWLRP